MQHNEHTNRIDTEDNRLRYTEAEDLDLMDDENNDMAGGAIAGCAATVGFIIIVAIMMLIINYLLTLWN